MAIETTLEGVAALLAVVIGLPTAALAWWSAARQRALEIRQPYRDKILETCFALSHHVGAYLNAPDERAYHEARLGIATIYSGAGQVACSQEFYVAFDRFGTLIWNLDFAEFERDEELFSRIETNAYSLLKETRKLLASTWNEKFSGFDAPPMKRRRKH
jgi:hypothetical protein